MDELLAMPEEARPWLWEGTLPAGGLSVLAAKPKVGKSTLARNLALAVALGEPFLGRATLQGPVVYLALEEKASEVKAHFASLGADGSELVHTHTGMAPQDALPALQAAIADTCAVLAIADPMVRMVRMADLNDYSQVNRAFEPLMKLARQTGCHILTVHHEGKGLREGGDAILGSTAILGGVDTALTMRQRDGCRTLESQQRYGPNWHKTVLAFDAATRRVASGGSLESRLSRETETKVLEALKAGAMTEAGDRGGGWG